MHRVDGMDGKVHVWVGGVGSPRGEEGVLRRLVDEGVAAPVSILRVAGIRPGLILQYPTVSQATPLCALSQWCPFKQCFSHSWTNHKLGQILLDDPMTWQRQSFMRSVSPTYSPKTDPCRVPRQCKRWTVTLHPRAETHPHLHHYLGLLWEVEAAPFGLARSVPVSLAHCVIQLVLSKNCPAHLAREQYEHGTLRQLLETCESNKGYILWPALI